MQKAAVTKLCSEKKISEMKNFSKRNLNKVNLYACARYWKNQFYCPERFEGRAGPEIDSLIFLSTKILEQKPLLDATNAVDSNFPNAE